MRFAGLSVLMLVMSSNVLWDRPLAAEHEDALPSPDHIPMVTEHHYRLSGAARPLLFWITRNDVGGGRMTWRKASDGTSSLELLMGSDPERAPFKTNRWGYIREVMRGDTAELLAVKSETEEETIAQAKASINDKERDRTLVFIQEHVTSSDAEARATIYDVGRDTTYRDLDYVLGRLPMIRDWNEQRRATRASSTRSGFLVALTELMRTGVEAWTAGGGSRVQYAPTTLSYIHRAKAYELRQSDVQLLHDITLNERRYARVLQGTFRIRNPETNYQSRFAVIYGLDGDVAAVPVRITYQPRWWLKTELTLE